MNVRVGPERKLSPEELMLLNCEGIHVPMCYRKDGTLYWDYNTVKKALE